MPLSCADSQASPHSFNFVPSSVNAGNRRSPHADEEHEDEMGPNADENGRARYRVSSSFPHYSYNEDEKAANGHTKATSSAEAGAPDTQWGVPWIGGMASVLSQPFSQTKDNGAQSQSGGFENLFSFGQGGKAKR
jgi:hypothetical protein